MPTIVVHSPRAEPGRFAFAMTASRSDQIAALREHAQRVGAVPFLLTSDCRSIDRIPEGSLALMTSDAAANCDIDTIPAALDRRVIVAAEVPPTPHAARAAARVALSITTTLLAQLGRDVARGAFIDALENVYRLETATLPPITWTAGRHTGTRAAWLMTLDVKEQKLLAEPGWVEAPSR
jgi:hypothetical protein